MRFAVVLKTYSWDSFVERQARRCASQAGAGDVFISADQTRGEFGSTPFAVHRIDEGSAVASGLADRFEAGSLFWWNADYAHHAFLADHPDYDYYAFVEYDCVLHVGLTELVTHAAALGADLVAEPFDLDDWYWTLFHRQVYPRGRLRATLNCVAIFSRRAMILLRDRRLAMSADPRVAYWPSAEAFIATEVASAGYNVVPLSRLGDVSAYRAAPPVLEEDLPALAARGVIHPVLDRQRYLASLLRSGTVVSYFRPNSSLRRQLARLPAEMYAPLLRAAAITRLKVRTREKLQRARVRLAGRLIADV